MTAAKLWRLLFGFTAPVSRRAYVTAGLALMAVKYAGDALLTHAFTGATLTPLQFLSPLLSARLPAALDASGTAALAVFALPFLWIGVSMSLRRAEDAGRSPWLGTLFLVPGANYLLMLLLALAPPGTTKARPANRLAAGGRASTLPAAMLGVAIACSIGVFAVAFTAFVSKTYGESLFFLTPFAMGASSAFILNRGSVRSLQETFGVALIAVAMSAGALLLFALEGALCIAMASPIAAVAACFGALIGRQIARTSPAGASAAMLLLLPAFNAVEGRSESGDSALYEVATSVVVDAPPEQVWPHVIQFPPLPAPEELIFKIGVAYPQSARIEGTGPGALRYCEFSTGPFVEPITRWDAPRALSFRVEKQPPGMQEWSPFALLHPPHLDSAIRSERGEFRLVPLPGNRTRLEGSTWYRLGLRPASYWRLWSEPMLHQIHQRVLNHVKALSERERR